MHFHFPIILFLSASSRSCSYRSLSFAVCSQAQTSLLQSKQKYPIIIFSFQALLRSDISLRMEKKSQDSSLLVKLINEKIDELNLCVGDLEGEIFQLQIEKDKLTSPKHVKSNLDLYDCLKILVDKSREAQEQLLNDKVIISISSNHSILKEYCLIRMKTARQTGHTTVGLQLMTEFKNALYLSPEQNTSNNLRKKFEKEYLCGASHTFRSVNTFLANTNKFKDLNLIIVDPACHVEEKYIGRLMTAFTSCLDFTKPCFMVMLE